MPDFGYGEANCLAERLMAIYRSGYHLFDIQDIKEYDQVGFLILCCQGYIEHVDGCSCGCGSYHGHFKFSKEFWTAFAEAEQTNHPSGLSPLLWCHCGETHECLKCHRPIKPGNWADEAYCTCNYDLYCGVCDKYLKHHGGVTGPPGPMGCVGPGIGDCDQDMENTPG